MSVQHGRLTACDRCGTTVFSECTGEGEADGGYTRWNKFEPLPDGWGQVTIPKKSSLSNPKDHRYVTVCPLCNAAWRTALEVYFCAGTHLDEWMAAMDYIRALHDCATCKHETDGRVCLDADCDCTACAERVSCACANCHNGSRWEWRHGHG